MFDMTALKTEQEVADLLHITRRTLYEERKRGTITLIRVGLRLIRYRDEDISDYIDRNTRRENPPVKELDI